MLAGMLPKPYMFMPKLGIRGLARGLAIAAAAAGF